VTGIDISLAYLQPYLSDQRRERTRPTLALANAENLPYDQAFDLVVASEILEHVLNVGDFLISLHRSLVPGGRTVIRVPYKEDLRQYARQSGCPYRFVHLRTFTRSSLVDMVRQSGFKIRRLYYDGHYEGRRRRATELLAPVFRPYFDRVLEDGVPSPGMSSGLARLLLRPVTLTAVCERV
jgi:SAM-dependent methyltransferase